MSQDKPVEAETPGTHAPLDGTPATPSPESPATATAGIDSPSNDIPSDEVPVESFPELLAKAARADEFWDRLLRTQADFDNFKKRAGREKQDAIRLANEGLLSSILPVLDNFDMALTAVEASPEAGLGALKTGVTMIANQLRSILKEAGLEEIDGMGKRFDPNFHEAVSQQESAVVPEDHVVQQLRKGYRYRERLLRPATVIVARKPALPETGAENNPG